MPRRSAARRARSGRLDAACRALAAAFFGAVGLLRRRDAIGRRGERLARRWLRRRGYRVLGANVRVGRDEADLVALDPDGRTIVVVEVKTTGSAAHDPVRRVDGWKRRRLRRVARALSRSAGGGSPVRIDTIGVLLPERGAPTIAHRVGAPDGWR